MMLKLNLNIWFKLMFWIKVNLLINPVIKVMIQVSHWPIALSNFSKFLKQFPMMLFPSQLRLLKQRERKFKKKTKIRQHQRLMHLHQMKKLSKWSLNKAIYKRHLRLQPKWLFKMILKCRDNSPSFN